MAASILPQELLELAMEQLVDDKHTLAQCSRVCHQWSCASSRYLFRKLRLRPQVQQQSQYDWYETFLLALQNSPRICASVRELVLTAERAGGQPVSTGVPACSGPVLQHILACLSRLRVFEMSHIDFAGSSKTSEFARGLPPLANLLKLERVQLSNVLGFSTHYGRIDECGTPDSFGLAEFLNIFEEIQELHLDNGALPFMYPVTWHLLEAHPKPLSRPLHQPLRLARVHLTGQHSTMALGVLQHMIDMRALKGLSLQLSLPVVRLADEFLSHASRLEHAHITLRRDLAPAHGTSAICLHGDPRLTAHRARRAYPRLLLAAAYPSTLHDRVPPGLHALRRPPLAACGRHPPVRARLAAACHPRHRPPADHRRGCGWCGGGQGPRLGCLQCDARPGSPARRGAPARRAPMSVDAANAGCSAVEAFPRGTEIAAIRHLY
ncbi:hypothetical protein PHLGIDRAFT_201588 [Phlebiopsis gigantea 11061_1 CR5-6]|uniref:F-box domain-containing protein n=1 Tax=Phlebiopsis gigantea (strain 11061_1 CR5-6) TaxID=745531 RepID=A0A0C3NHM5_PHLG1|nr:hypothetical protein PHLGIDRAFT_201588 [Phlebiopsis gigantea 11061_1 CR5-6]